VIARPTRIRMSRAKGWRLPEGAVSVARPGPLGNPLVVGKYGDAAKCVTGYAAILAGFWPGGAIEQSECRASRAAALSRLDELRGKTLACWCALDKPCHANVLLLLANAPKGKAVRPDTMSWRLPGLAS
jgi:Domain of unknown function (DUF4326)